MFVGLCLSFIVLCSICVYVKHFRDFNSFCILTFAKGPSPLTVHTFTEKKVNEQPNHCSLATDMHFHSICLDQAFI